MWAVTALLNGKTHRYEGSRKIDERKDCYNAHDLRFLLLLDSQFVDAIGCLGLQALLDLNAPVQLARIFQSCFVAILANTHQVLSVRSDSG